jgi:hypothetical protein
MISPQVLQAIIIAFGNFFGILASYYLLDRRIEGKLTKYWSRIKNSEEGRNIFTIAEDLKNLLEGEEPQKLLTEASKILMESRVILKAMKERLEPDEEGDDEEPRLPTLGPKGA